MYVKSNVHALPLVWQHSLRNNGHHYYNNVEMKMIWYHSFLLLGLMNLKGRRRKKRNWKGIEFVWCKSKNEEKIGKEETRLVGLGFGGGCLMQLEGEVCTAHVVERFVYFKAWGVNYWGFILGFGGKLDMLRICYFVNAKLEWEKVS